MSTIELIMLFGALFANVLVTLIRTMLSERAVLRELAEVRRELAANQALLAKHDYSTTIFMAKVDRETKTS